MIGYLLMVIVRDDCLFVDGNGERWLFVNGNGERWLLQTIISHHYHQQTIISHHYHQQTNNHLSPLTSTNKQSSFTITINKQTAISHHYHQQINMEMVRGLFVNDVNGERWLFVCWW
jgi:hypothetical protein